MPHEDGFVEALEAETLILRKRVAAASSRCLLESCFLNRKNKQRHRGAGQVCHGSTRSSLANGEANNPSGGGCQLVEGESRLRGSRKNTDTIDEMSSSFHSEASHDNSVVSGAGDSVRLSGVYL